MRNVILFALRLGVKACAFFGKVTGVPRSPALCGVGLLVLSSGIIVRAQDAERGAPFLRGDGNGDGSTDVADAVFTLVHLFVGNARPSCHKSMDANDDGNVDLADAVAILDHLFRRRGALPAPSVACGQDPTRDDLPCRVHMPCSFDGGPGPQADHSEVGLWKPLDCTDDNGNVDDCSTDRVAHAVLLKNSVVLTCGSGRADAFESPTHFVQHVSAVPLQDGVPTIFDLFCSGHVNLADGRALWVGGTSEEGPGNYYEGYRNALTFDPDTFQWELVADMADQRWYPTATVLNDGKVLVTGGETYQNHPDNVPDTVINRIPEIYDPADGPLGSWTPLENAAVDFWANYTFMFLLPDPDEPRVFFAGCEGCGNQTYTLSLTDDPLGNAGDLEWTPVGTHDILGGSAVMYRPGRIMKAGGYGGEAATSGTATIDMNLDEPEWKEDDAMATPRFDLNLVILPTGQVLAVGGRTLEDDSVDDHVQDHDGDAVMEAELWTPPGPEEDTGTWSTLAPMSFPRTYHSVALLLPDATVFVAGAEQPSELFFPPYLFDGNEDAVRPTIECLSNETLDLNQPCPNPDWEAKPLEVGYRTAFRVRIEETADKAIYEDARFVLIRPGSVTHGFDMEQRYIELCASLVNCRVNGPGTVLADYTVSAPRHGYIAPPGAYMLFAVSATGVPSVAKMIHMTDDIEPGPCPASLSHVLGIAEKGVGSVGEGAGATVALIDDGDDPDLIFMAYDGARGQNAFKYKIGWNAGDGMPDWSDPFPPVDGVGHEGHGAGIAALNLDEDPRTELLLMAYDNGTDPDQNTFKYRVLWNLTSDGDSSEDPSPVIHVDGVGERGDGAGVAVMDLNCNGRPDVVFMAYDGGVDQNSFKYKVGMDLGADGVAASWGDRIYEDGLGHAGHGAGIEIADLNSNGIPDMILMAYDAPEGQNRFKLKVGCDLDEKGETDSWSDVISIDGLGTTGEGAGLTFAELGLRSGEPGLILMAYDAPDGPNTFKYRIGSF